MISHSFKTLIQTLFLAVALLFLVSCASNQPLLKQAEKTKKKDKEKPRPKPLPKIYRPKMMAEEPDEKARKPSNQNDRDLCPLCDSSKPCK